MAVHLWAIWWDHLFSFALRMQVAKTNFDLVTFALFSAVENQDSSEQQRPSQKNVCFLLERWYLADNVEFSIFGSYGWDKNMSWWIFSLSSCINYSFRISEHVWNRSNLSMTWDEQAAVAPTSLPSAWATRAESGTAKFGKEHHQVRSPETGKRTFQGIQDSCKGTVVSNWFAFWSGVLGRQILMTCWWL